MCLEVDYTSGQPQPMIIGSAVFSLSGGGYWKQHSAQSQSVVLLPFVWEGPGAKTARYSLARTAGI